MQPVYMRNQITKTKGKTSPLLSWTITEPAEPEYKHLSKAAIIRLPQIQPYINQAHNFVILKYIELIWTYIPIKLKTNKLASLMNQSPCLQKSEEETHTSK